MADEALIGTETAGGQVARAGKSAFWQRFASWSRRHDVPRWLAIGLACAALTCGAITYATMSGSAPFAPDPQTILILLNVDLVLLLLLGALVASQLVRLWIERRRGAAGARLHTRMAALFSFVALTPTIVVAVFSALFLHFGMQSWFSEKVSSAINRSQAVVQTYVQEQGDNLRISTLAAAMELNGRASHLARTPQFTPRLLTDTAAALSLSEAIMFRRNGEIVARNDVEFAAEIEPIPDWAINSAEEGKLVILPGDGDRMRALIKLAGFIDVYLYVVRSFQPEVVDHTRHIQAVIRDYQRLEDERYGIQITFVIIFILIALLVLLSAVWLGLQFANRIAHPIGGLIAAADRVRAGELAARVEEPPQDHEIGSLSRAFNRMTGQIHNQQQALQDANLELDERRRFTEAVLAGVSAGVIGLDADGRITLPNPSALALLDASESALTGRVLEDAIPETADLLARARTRSPPLVEDQIELVRGEHRRTLLVRIVTERDGHRIDGFVVTFDDISALVSAQRRAAWADVAQRLAHEIKNPLTPIQLSAQRLRRKYLDEVSTQPEVFEDCTDIIVRQVGDIREMIDAFSAFARMPAPVLERVDLIEVVERAAVLHRLSSPEIAFDIERAEDEVYLDCDAGQIGRALTNVLKNAIEAIESRDLDDKPAGRIKIRVCEDEGQWRIEVEDNGPGLPEALRGKLTEPYVTNRADGTGLGLAIVRRIMEDHGGRLLLENGAAGGARVTLVFAAPGTEHAIPENGES
ncbi:MAG: PAS domain-containing sensor histidine kinase [Rhodospirillales bacterium]|nr:PAS domain-containing sensor histidine kinase [Rhodospirillales bacterium]MDE0379484.1 PAS domain-containing sensor histidine kinase [Rhodospirillales bacterium]